MRRRLTLQRETLTALDYLTADELAEVAGGITPTTPIVQCLLSPHLPAVEESLLPCNTRPCTS